MLMISGRLNSSVKLSPGPFFATPFVDFEKGLGFSRGWVSETDFLTEGGLEAGPDGGSLADQDRNGALSPTTTGVVEPFQM